MSQNLSVKRWPQELALEEVMLRKVPFWIHMKGVLLHLSTEVNAKKLASHMGEVIEIEELSLARGFLRARVLVDTDHPLISGCWLPRPGDKESWIRFRYERLQDFCYRCGRIGHVMTECTFEKNRSGAAGFGEWTRMKQPRPL
ncbi:uncharacterized protein LOC126622870 [Malus sylvestris]|uniref:uncharacterized protein LOC126622870 n=1 Tax=Malus sylvestris TaxID=3752 RepID=UPI0021AC776B|nr:uncharacterized protein LOC126622870 [Malus sylvestris]